MVDDDENSRIFTPLPHPHYFALFIYFDLNQCVTSLRSSMLWDWQSFSSKWELWFQYPPFKNFDISNFGESIAHKAQGFSLVLAWILMKAQIQVALLCCSCSTRFLVLASAEYLGGFLSQLRCSEGPPNSLVQFWASASKCLNAE